MSERIREIAMEPARCGCCDRLVEVCAADPCADVREDRVMVGKVEALLRGERVVCSDEQYEEVIRMLDLLPGDPGARLASVPNPQRVGTLDLWVAFIKPERKEG